MGPPCGWLSLEGRRLRFVLSLPSGSRPAQESCPKVPSSESPSSSSSSSPCRSSESSGGSRIPSSLSPSPPHTSGARRGGGWLGRSSTIRSVRSGGSPLSAGSDSGGSRGSRRANSVASSGEAGAIERSRSWLRRRAGRARPARAPRGALRPRFDQRARAGRGGRGRPGGLPSSPGNSDWVAVSTGITTTGAALSGRRSGRTPCAAGAPQVEPVEPVDPDQGQHQHDPVGRANHGHRARDRARVVRGLEGGEVTRERVGGPSEGEGPAVEVVVEDRRDQVGEEHEQRTRQQRAVALVLESTPWTRTPGTGGPRPVARCRSAKGNSEEGVHDGHEQRGDQAHERGRDQEEQRVVIAGQADSPVVAAPDGACRGSVLRSSGGGWASMFMSHIRRQAAGPVRESRSRARRDRGRWGRGAAGRCAGSRPGGSRSREPRSSPREAQSRPGPARLRSRSTAAAS